MTKKIMFNDRYGLTEAVLDESKTQTRRMCKTQPPYENFDIAFPCCWKDEDNPEKDPLYGAFCWVNKDNPKEHTNWIKPTYRFGEIVAIAQSYNDVSESISKTESKEKAMYYVKVMNACYPKSEVAKDKCDIAGWHNKMFVKADLMPHKIRILDIKLQRLQGISEEDCIKEGIIKKWNAIDGRNYYYIRGSRGKLRDIIYKSARSAYTSLIDKISGKGTWKSNPYVFAYTFKLIK